MQGLFRLCWPFDAGDPTLKQQIDRISFDGPRICVDWVERVDPARCPRSPRDAARQACSLDRSRLSLVLNPMQSPPLWRVSLP